MANDTEKQRWNDGTWARIWMRREPMTAQVTPFLLDALALQPGEHVLDIGCGGGGTSIAEARAVGSGGTVVGADLSGPLLALAKGRAEEAGVSNVTFVQADAQTDRLGDGDYDVATSQFGVMFFDQAVTAFANIGRHLRPGGRLVFACWQSMAENPWFPGAALAGFLPAPPPPGEGTTPTGPFALGDPTWVHQLLRESGFDGVEVEPKAVAGEATRDTLMDDEQLIFMGLDPARLAEVHAAFDRYLSQFGDPAGTLRFPLAFHLVRARRP